MNPLIAIDPGTKGCGAVLDVEGIHIYRFDRPQEWADFLSHLHDVALLDPTCLMEHIWARPASGDNGNFQSGQGKMMQEYGRAQGVLEAYDIPWESITAKKWQRLADIRYPDDCSYSCRKRYHQKRAIELWESRIPTKRIIQQVSDALILLHILESNA